MTFASLDDGNEQVEHLSAEDPHKLLRTVRLNLLRHLRFPSQLFDHAEHVQRVRDRLDAGVGRCHLLVLYSMDGMAGPAGNGGKRDHDDQADPCRSSEDGDEEPRPEAKEKWYLHQGSDEVLATRDVCEVC
jgi:hypothetical protein